MNPRINRPVSGSVANDLATSEVNDWADLSVGYGHEKEERPSHGDGEAGGGVGVAKHPVTLLMKIGSRSVLWLAIVGLSKASTGAQMESILSLLGMLTKSRSSFTVVISIHTRLDQTTRIHGPITNVDIASQTWIELARPQVHGYNVHDVVFLNALKFVSIADEKVARVFEAPRTFVTLVENLGIESFAPEEVSSASSGYRLAYF